MKHLAPAPRRFGNKKHLLLVAGCAVFGVALLLVVMPTGVGAVVNDVVLGLREAGPLVFFVAMALLPAAGFPLLAFTLTAGPVFTPVLGAGWVMMWSVAAVVVNLLLTYWLARRALRPLVIRLLTWCGFHLPEEAPAGAWQLTLMVRLTPGPPFWAQSYVLGLLRVPLGPYLVVSTLVMTGYIAALVYGGAAIMQGNGRLGFAAVAGLAVLVAARQLWRKHAARRVPAAPVAVPVE
jgi:uncharacterized membrane protein YdjX (TVP38/TMEM64 family)